MKVIRKLSDLLGTLLVTVMILLAVLLVGVRLIGLTPYAVLSGSMEPTYHVGSLIYVQDIDPADVTVGTPLTFVVNEDLLLATHRVVGIEVRNTKEEAVLDEGGNPTYDEHGNMVTQTIPLDEPAYYFTTKGDANEDIDGSQVYYKNIVGTPRFSIPYLGYLSSWLQTKRGMIMGASIALVLLILTFIPDLLNMVDDEPAQPKEKKQKNKKEKKPKKNRKLREEDEQQEEEIPAPQPEPQAAVREEEPVIPAKPTAVCEPPVMPEAPVVPAADPAPEAPAVVPAAEAMPEIPTDNPAESEMPRRRRRRPVVVPQETEE
ncbi:MAG: signal peptidase I [Clostridia bacterium]|nr:signal peptidase I [Clostridia bacterium]